MEPPPAKVVNPYYYPSRRRATFNDDANETRMFSSADENPWDGYDSALDDESALEEESTSEDEAGARTGEKAKDVAWSRVRASFIVQISMLMNNNCALTPWPTSRTTHPVAPPLLSPGRPPMRVDPLPKYKQIAPPPRLVKTRKECHGFGLFA